MKTAYCWLGEDGAVSVGGRNETPTAVTFDYPRKMLAFQSFCGGYSTFIMVLAVMTVNSD